MAKKYWYEKKKPGRKKKSEGMGFGTMIFIGIVLLCLYAWIE